MTTLLLPIHKLPTKFQFQFELSLAHFSPSLFLELSKNLPSYSSYHVWNCEENIWFCIVAIDIFSFLRIWQKLLKMLFFRFYPFVIFHFNQNIWVFSMLRKKLNHKSINDKQNGSQQQNYDDCSYVKESFVINQANCNRYCSADQEWGCKPFH